MDFLPSGSPSQRGFRYRVVEWDSPIQAPRRSPTSRSSLAPFSYRLVSPRPSISESGQISNMFSSGSDTELVIPEFDRSEFIEQTQEPPDAPSLSRMAKTAAVQALLTQSQAFPETKPICDRIYARFFQKFGEWNLQCERRRGREPIQNAFDETQVVAARNALENLKAETETWEHSDMSMDIPERAPAIVAHLNAEVHLTPVEKLVAVLDRVGVRAGQGISSAIIMDQRGDEVARAMNEDLV